MDGARDPSSVAVKPAYTADGEWGWFGPNTIPGEQWANHITAEFLALLTGLGVADFDPEDDGQVAAALLPRIGIAGFFSDKMEIGDPLGFGIGATIIDTEGGEVGPLYGYVETDKVFVEYGLYTGTQAAPVERMNSAGDLDVRNADFSSDGTVGVRINAAGGRVRAGGNIKVGGDVEAGTGETIDLDGATGIATVSGGLDLGYGTASGSNTPTINQVSGLIVTASLTTAALADETITLTSDKMDSASMVFANVSNYTGAGTPIVRMVTRPGATTAGIVLHNMHATNALDAAVTLRFVVFNPA